MAVLELISGGLLLADFIYHRLNPDQDKTKENFADSIDFPQSEEGTPVPYIYGRVRVTRPILAWHSAPGAYTDGHVKYVASMFFVLGVPFADGDSTNRIHTMWQGDLEYGTRGKGNAFVAPLPPSAPSVDLDQLDGNGDREDINRGLGLVGYITDADGVIVPPGAIVPIGAVSREGGCVEFLNGNPNQQLFNLTTPFNAANWTTRAGLQMMQETPDFEVNAKQIPGFRGVLSALLYHWEDTGGASRYRFVYGNDFSAATASSSHLAPFSFEVSSYKDNASYPATGSMARLGHDSNPINVIYDLMVSKRKLGIPTSRIDFDSFARAAEALYQESHGFSRCFDSRMPARDMIREILKQIDAMLFEDTKTGKYKIRLIRPDHDVSSLPHITRSNCKALQNLAISGLTGVPNMVQLVYTSRERGYVDASVIAQDPANAVGQDGEEREAQLSYPGITHEALAAAVGLRELGWLSRPLIKCRALVFREFLDLEPGAAVRLTWSKPDISGLVFRVAGPPYHGTLRDGVIALDLISDNSYQYRALPPQPPLPHPDIGSGIVLGMGMR